MSSVTFGSHIASERKRQGVSQKELASKILREDDGKQISPQYLNDIERDRRQPTSDHLIRQFAEVLGIEADYLFYLAGTLPEDVRRSNIGPEEAKAAMSAFRRGG